MNAWESIGYFLFFVAIGLIIWWVEILEKKINEVERRLNQ